MVNGVDHPFMPSMLRFNTVSLALHTHIFVYICEMCAYHVPLYYNPRRLSKILLDHQSGCYV